MTAISLGKGVIDLLRSAASLETDDLKRQALEEQLAKADHQFRIAETKLAEDLGYQLCRCTWPAQILLLRHGRYKCPACGENHDADPCYGG